MDAPDRDTFTVSQLNRLIRDALAITFPDELWVEGEIASLRRHAASGNVYFQLVDPGPGVRATQAGPGVRATQAGPGDAQPEAALAVVLYRANKEAVNRLLRRARPSTPDAEALSPAIRMADGVHIRIRGGVELVPRTGRLHLRMTGIDPAHTLGRLAAQRDRVLATLAAEGLLDANARRPYPLLPTKLGLITSGGSAAQADFLNELGLHELDRAGMAGHPVGWRIKAVLSRVQGPGADRELAAAVRSLDTMDVDVIAVVRGGGARTDLMAFDSELLARAIAGARVPVITGIGHEIDSSVADRVAARAYKTPTACAAALAEQARDAVERSESAWAGIADRAGELIESRSAELQATGRRVAFASRVRLDEQATRARFREQRLRAAAGAVLAGADRDLAAHAARVDAVDPARALARGWSITRTADGRLVRVPADAPPGTALVTTVAAGEIQSTVTP